MTCGTDCPCGSDPTGVQAASDPKSCRHPNPSFDRSICACGSMHYYCDECGDQLDSCVGWPEQVRAAEPMPAEAKGDAGDVFAKLDVWSEYAPLAYDFICEWLSTEEDLLLAMAKGRHVHGHYLYGDRNYTEYDEDRLIAEAAEELADCINYITRLLHMRASRR